MAISKALVAVILLTGGMAFAETEVDAYGLGPHDPVPETWLKLDEDLSVRLRILNRKGEVADMVETPQVLNAEVSFFGREGAADRDVKLTCTARFVDAEAGWSDAVIDDKPCYEGRLSDATGKFVPLRMRLEFRPVATDPAGTSAVVVEVTDLVVDDSISLWATYDWQGGMK